VFSRLSIEGGRESFFFVGNSLVSPRGFGCPRSLFPVPVARPRCPVPIARDDLDEQVEVAVTKFAVVLSEVMCDLEMELGGKFQEQHCGGVGVGVLVSGW
jgi:hypothetical protein